MINELAYLSKVMKRGNISARNWHREYKAIPNISVNSPCVRLIISDGQLSRIEPIGVEMGKQLRRFGSNQGFYPGMNLQPLYRLTNEEHKKALQKVVQRKAEPDFNEIRSWCTESNWGPKFQKKYAQSMVAVPGRLESLLSGKFECAALNTLLAETNRFANPELLYAELEKEAFRLLELKTDCLLALRILFHPASAEKQKDADCGSLSVFFDCQALIDSDCPVVSVGFTQELNRRLIEADTRTEKHSKTVTDAFGNEFVPFKEPMPQVKLAGGFDATLRTMFGGQPCQNRYGFFEGDTYPISKEKRTELASSLAWLGSEEHRHITWENTDLGEILFAYPLMLENEPISYVNIFMRQKSSKNKTFEEEAKAFLSAFRGKREKSDDSNADRIQLFILRKIKKACTKVIYTTTTDAHEIERRSEVWSSGNKNLPTLRIGQLQTLFPLDTADILNCQLKQDGTVVAKDFHPIPKYHGMELFFGAGRLRDTDLSMLVRNMESIAPMLGKCISAPETKSSIDINHVKRSATLIGLLLYQLGIEKENYMKEIAYAYGQLLKVSDELHVLYCMVERKGDIPTQLVGGSLYMSVSSAPQRTMGVLGERMNPYLRWAKSYFYRDTVEKGVEPWRIGWLISLYERYAELLMPLAGENAEISFSDTEKAQLFLGFIAAFPRKNGNRTSNQNNINTENGGNENE